MGTAGPAVLAILASTAPAAGAGTPPPPVSNVQVQIGQGQSRFFGAPKWRARGAVSFTANAANVRCEDKIVLERRVREVVNRQFRYRWIEIAKGDQRERSSGTTTGQRPVTVRSAISLYHGDAPYRRLLQSTPLRLRYEYRITVGGALNQRRSVVRPVTLATLSQAYRSHPA